MISIIMLTYNRDTMVSNVIDDIFKQTYDNYELIIVNNGSTDSTSELIHRVASSDSRIRFIELEKSETIGKARNIGVQMSKGEYLTFVDDDDRIKHDYLSFLMGLLKEFSADISICGCSEGDGITCIPQCIYDERMVIDGITATELLIRRKKIRAGMPTKMYKREIIEKYPFEENCKNEDIHTQYKYLLDANKVAVHDVDKYYILRHQNNVSSFTSEASRWTYSIMSDYIRAYRNRTEYIKNKAPSLFALAKYSEWSFYISMVDKIKRYNLTDCKELGEQLIELLFLQKNEFLNCSEIQDFEKRWMDQYVLDPCKRGL